MSSQNNWGWMVRRRRELKAVVSPLPGSPSSAVPNHRLLVLGDMIRNRQAMTRAASSMGIWGLQKTRPCHAMLNNLSTP
jgi:hypothetical protein